VWLLESPLRISPSSSWFYTLKVRCELRKSPKEGRFFVSLKLCDDATMLGNGVLVVAFCVWRFPKGVFEVVLAQGPRTDASTNG
jgi:hypothetical protein